MITDKNPIEDNAGGMLEPSKTASKKNRHIGLAIAAVVFIAAVIYLLMA